MIYSIIIHYIIYYIIEISDYDVWCPGPTLESARRHGRSVLPLPARLCIFLWVRFVVIPVSWAT